LDRETNTTPPGGSGSEEREAPAEPSSSVDGEDDGGVHSWSRYLSDARP